MGQNNKNIEISTWKFNTILFQWLTMPMKSGDKMIETK